MNPSEKKKVERICAEYTEKQPTYFDALCELDARVKRPANIIAYSYGSAGSLVLGTGMCLAMKVIGSAVLPGVVIGGAGIAMVSSTYTLYKKILAERRAKHKEEINKLSEKIFQQEKQNEAKTVEE